MATGGNGLGLGHPLRDNPQAITPRTLRGPPEASLVCFFGDFGSGLIRPGWADNLFENLQKKSARHHQMRRRLHYAVNQTKVFVHCSNQSGLSHSINRSSP